jgi:hypothetical protein
MTDGTETDQVAAGKSGFDLDAWIRQLCALVVAGVAAYASYVHQREFALQGGMTRRDALRRGGVLVARTLAEVAAL